MAEVADAIAQSFSARPIKAQSRDGFAFDDTVAHKPPFGGLYEFTATMSEKTVP